MNAKLTPRQITDLILVALRAWQRQTKAGLTEASFDDWRHGVCMNAVQRAGFREARQGDYCELRASLHRLAGEDGQALHWFTRAVAELQRQLVWKVRQQLSRAGLTDGYAAAIAHRSRLDACTTEELTSILAALHTHAKRHPAIP